MIAMVMSRFSLISFRRSIVLLVSARAMPAVGSSSSRSFRVLHQTHGHLQPPLVASRHRRCLFMCRLSIMLTSISICLGLRRPARFSLADAPRKRACGTAPSRLAKQGIIMFSMTSRSPKISGVWNTRQTPIWLISCGVRPSRDCPLKIDRPFIRDQLADEAVQERRLAGTVRPNDRVDGLILNTRGSHPPAPARPPNRLPTPLTSRSTHLSVSSYSATWGVCFG